MYECRYHCVGAEDARAPALSTNPTAAPGVTARLKVRYRHVTPLDETLRFEGWLAETRGTRRTARATCHAGDTLTADAEGIFVVVDFDEVRERMSARRRNG